ncbi:MAG: DUF3332 domain-containing protein [Bacteroidaceae bacterium]|nr:DUF3332 domain-containing protein [Bacteroidaceae bacterium]
MKKNRITIVSSLLAATMLFSSCVGSFSLFNKFAKWNMHATSEKFLNEIIFLVLSPVYSICGLADILVFNTIEFWSGNNPIAAVGSTRHVVGSNGDEYIVRVNKDGYTVTNKTRGEEMDLVYNEESRVWSSVKDGVSTEIVKVNEDGTTLTLNGFNALGISAAE